MNFFSLFKKTFRVILSYAKHCFRREIIVNGYFKYDEKGCLKHNNFGDDINFPILEALTGGRINSLQKVGIHRIDHLLCIGSVLEYCNEHSIVWGSGAMWGNKQLGHHPKKVCAVRGPLTQQYLIKEGVDCPQIYGDPALLLPYIFRPLVEKRYRIGFIPHYVDYDLPHVKQFRENHPEILFIKFEGYASWQDVVIQINSCECIVSSSLHGLIVSDAYKIPNVRVIFSDKIKGGDFKYKDYMAGVGREYREPVNCRKEILLDEILEGLMSYDCINFNPQPLLDSFPYRKIPIE